MILAIRLLLHLFSRLASNPRFASRLFDNHYRDKNLLFVRAARGPESVFSINARLMSLAGWIIARGEEHAIGPPEDDRYVVAGSLERELDQISIRRSQVCYLLFEFSIIQSRDSRYNFFPSSLPKSQDFMNQ